MTAFMSCPNELLVVIFSAICKKDLLALSLTCKSLRPLAQSWLYRKIQWTWNGIPENNLKIFLLLRSLVESPELIQFIEHFYALADSENMPRFIWSQHDHASFPIADLALLQGLVDTLQLPAANKWKQMIEYGQIDVFVALLLSRVSYLRTLEIGFGLLMNFKFAGIMLRHLSSSSVPAPVSPMFIQLRRVDISMDRMGGNHKCLSMPCPRTDLQLSPRKFDDIRPLFFLPSMRYLRLWIQNPSDLLWQREVFGLSNLTSLVIHHSEAWQDTISQLLSFTPYLERFEYYYNGCTDSRYHDRPSSYLDCAKLSEALSHVKSTIRFIVIFADWYSTSGADLETCHGWGIKRNLESMRDFARLESLIVPLVVLLGKSPLSSAIKLADHLPPSLCELCLTDELNYMGLMEWRQQDYLERFQAYLHRWQEHSPNLSTISLKIDCPSSSHRWAYGAARNHEDDYSVLDLLVENQHALAELCEEAGIEFKVVRSGKVMRE